jgi:hypothetical protein
MVAIVAVAMVGIVTAISSMIEAHAVSCQQIKGKDVCYGCAPKSQGFFSSDTECTHSTT